MVTRKNAPPPPGMVPFLICLLMKLYTYYAPFIFLVSSYANCSLKFQQECAYLHRSQLHKKSSTVNRATFPWRRTTFSVSYNSPAQFLHL
jgi:hypothetical protein